MILNYLHLDVLLKVDQATKGEVPVKCLWLLSICRYLICTTSKYPRFLEKLVFLYYYVDMVLFLRLLFISIEKSILFKSLLGKYT